MNRIRLLPIVLFAATALLLLKTMGLVTQGQYALTGTEFAVAQSQTGLQSEIDENLQLSLEEEAAARRAADSLFATSAGTVDAGDDAAQVLTEDRNGVQIPIEDIDENAVTERAVLERLSQRRAELDLYADELALRADLVTAAEARLGERLDALEALEVRVQSLVDQFDAKSDEQFGSLVSMYENMKSADAAAVFNTLDTDILLRMATNMSPRKMSTILADMNTARAQELTIRLATLNSETEIPPEATPTQQSDALPQIVGQ